MTNADESPTNRLTPFWLNISLFDTTENQTRDPRGEWFNTLPTEDFPLAFIYREGGLTHRHIKSFSYFHMHIPLSTAEVSRIPMNSFKFSVVLQGKLSRETYSEHGLCKYVARAYTDEDNGHEYHCQDNSLNNLKNI